MHRRTFIQAAAASLLIPSGLAAARTAATQGSLKDVDYFFYDERFAQARRLAEQTAVTRSVTPVRGDVTGVWNDGLKQACRQSPLTLHGVTTESFRFCLEVMLRSHAHIETQVARINADLLRWTIRSNTKPITG